MGIHRRADGSIQLTTVLPGAIFGPALTADNFGSLQILSRMLEGRVPRYPSLAFEVVDVRDVADLHIRAMTAPEAEGERFIATGELLWMGEVAAILREQLGRRRQKYSGQADAGSASPDGGPVQPRTAHPSAAAGPQATALLGESPTDAWLAAQTRRRHGGR